uniref:Uncharacterized protein n=1 Tax=Xiphophorus maculatus TaxID=8083 RepID=A0A3B5R438_XIPMA
MALIADLVTDIILARDIGGFISSIANNCAPLYEWEYYLDYLDPVFVDESQLKYHKYSIVIILWVSLAAFVGFLFLILNLMSLIGLLVCLHGERCPDARGRSQESAQTGSTERPSHPTCKEEITQTLASMTKRHSVFML